MGPDWLVGEQDPRSNIALEVQPRKGCAKLKVQRNARRRGVGDDQPAHADAGRDLATQSAEHPQGEIELTGAIEPVVGAEAQSNDGGGKRGARSKQEHGKQKRQ